MYRSGWRIKPKHETICVCGHEHVCHYTRDGNCVYQACDCKEFKPKGRQEFNSRRALCDYGHSHDSGLEIKTCFELHCLKNAQQIKDYRSHPLVDLPGPSGSVVATYEVDFSVEHNDGSTEYIECKGEHLMREGQWPLKWKLLQDKHKGDPTFKFRLVRR